MPSRPFHEAVGILVGAAATYAACRMGHVSPSAMHYAAGIVAASVGALMPDWLEPPFSRRHRGFFHSMFVLAALAVCIAALLSLRLELWHRLIALSFASGYTSHLVCDFGTSGRLPLITKGL